MTKDYALEAQKSLDTASEVENFRWHLRVAQVYALLSIAQEINKLANVLVHP